MLTSVCNIDKVSATASEVDTGLSSGADMQGVARIREALEAHAWPGLHMKEQYAHLSGGDFTTSRNSTLELPNGQQASVEVHASSSADVAAHQLTESAQRHVDGAEQRGHAASETASTSEPARASVSTEAVVSTAQNGASANGLHEPEDPDVHPEVDSFDRLLGTVTAARRQLQVLPDDERRARAATLAMQMLEAFGLEEDDDLSD